MTNKKVIDVLLKLKNNGTLDLLYDHGLLVPKAITWMEMSLKYNSYIKQGYDKKQARRMVSELSNDCDERTVFRAIGLMNRKV